MTKYVPISKVPIGTTVEFFSGMYVKGKILERYTIGVEGKTWVVLEVEGRDRPWSFSYASHRSVKI